MYCIVDYLLGRLPCSKEINNVCNHCVECVTKLGVTTLFLSNLDKLSNENVFLCYLYRNELAFDYDHI